MEGYIAGPRAVLYSFSRRHLRQAQRRKLVGATGARSLRNKHRPYPSKKRCHKEKSSMATHKTGTREQWLKVRVELLGDFSFDFNVSFTEGQQRGGGLDYNYPGAPPTSDVFRWRAGQECGGDSAEARLAAMSGTDVPAYHRDR